MLNRRLLILVAVAALLVLSVSVATLRAEHRDGPLVIVMTNDPDAEPDQGLRRRRRHVLLQTLSTRGKGGVGGNASGVKQYNGELFAVVNNGSDYCRDLHARRQPAEVRQAGDRRPARR